ncbi:hypothetical protein KQI42_07030 [Tissierella sp. MSJ-40]|uniref:Uncharacterized protein n=1 Tax=Tissierella simiarum TaxID=2841534 RepID=A0ABS6E6A7_9FIRM|nr:hypothetical protein [Tissierella simiarum]MBU5437754.1 hypothetical protein [Tissierella simiarum]
MRRYYYRYRYKTKKIIGIALGIVGGLILINVIPIGFLLFIIGIALLIMGLLILKIK